MADNDVAELAKVLVIKSSHKRVQDQGLSTQQLLTSTLVICCSFSHVSFMFPPLLPQHCPLLGLLCVFSFYLEDFEAFLNRYSVEVGRTEVCISSDLF